MERSPTTEEALGPVLVEEEEGKLPFLVHLEELRWRLVRSILWTGLGMLVTFRFAREILAWFIRPVGTVVFLSPVEPFLAYLKVAFVGGIAVASPLIAWEMWGFFGPALFPRERRSIFLLVPVSVGLFFLGVWFCWRFLLPAGLKFLLSFASENLTPMLTVGSYVSFAGWLLIGCGLVFQTPIVVMALARLGIVSPRTLLRQWRIAVVVILVLAAVITPTPDVANQLLLAIPMGILYFLSVGLAFLVKKHDPIRAN